MKTKKPQKLANRKNEGLEEASYSNLETLVKNQLFGVGITNETEENVLEYIGSFLQKTQKKMYIVTPNPEMIMLSQGNTAFKNALNKADLALCDGVGLYKAGQILGKPFKERIIGTNFVEKVCEMIADWPITVGLLGGGHGVAEKTSECLKARFPGLKVAFAGSDTKDLVVLPASEMPMILFVAFGAPKQELWMAEYINKIPVRVMMGVGGAFDQIIDSSLRPPYLAHLLGLGWLYRLIRQPWRLKRQLVLVPFMGMVLKEKLFPSNI